MSIQKVFDNKDLREYILSYLYSFDKIIELDKVYIFELHKHNKNFIMQVSIVYEFKQTVHRKPL